MNLNMTQINIYSTNFLYFKQINFYLLTQIYNPFNNFFIPFIINYNYNFSNFFNFYYFLWTKKIKLFKIFIFKFFKFNNIKNNHTLNFKNNINYFFTSSSLKFVKSNYNLITKSSIYFNKNLIAFKFFNLSNFLNISNWHILNYFLTLNKSNFYNLFLNINFKKSFLNKITTLNSLNIIKINNILI